MIEQKLHQGIAAAKAGKKEEARTLLMAVLEADENQIQAWVWLSYVMDDLEDKEICFENILVLDPTNQFAQKGLAWLNTNKSVKPSKSKPPLSSETVPQNISEPSTTLTTTKPIVANAAVMGYSEFDNEWLCPYCIALTTPDDVNCPKCNKSLYIKKRVVTERSVSLWRAFFLQIYTALYTISFALGYFVIQVKFYKLAAPFSFWPVYFGLPTDQSPQQIELLLSFFPIWLFWIVNIILFYTLSQSVWIYFRLPWGHFIFLLNAAIVFLISGLAPFILWHNMVLFGSMMGVVLGFVHLFLSINMWRDFSFTETRLVLTIDSHATNATSLFLSARDYAEQGMWGQAVIHLRRAIAKNPHKLGYHLALIDAYFHVKRYDLAERALKEAYQLNPTSAEVKHLQQELKERVNSEQ